MDDSITYTAGSGPHATALERLGAMAAETDSDGTTNDYWQAVAMAVAREVLSDPLTYARALGLPVPAYSILVDTPKPNPCPECGCHIGHLTGCTYLFRMTAPGPKASRRQQKY